MTAVLKEMSPDRHTIELTPRCCVVAFVNALLGARDEFFNWRVTPPYQLESPGGFTFVCDAEMCLPDRRNLIVKATLPLEPTVSMCGVTVDVERWRVVQTVVEVKVADDSYFVCWGISRDNDLCVWYVEKTVPLPRYWLEFREQSRLFSEKSLAATAEGIPIHPDRIA